MADDKKKSKIDLKARLGKTTTMSGGPVPAVPLPVPGPGASSPGVPPGSAPPPADSNPSTPGGVPVPAAPSSGGGSVRPPTLGIAPPPGLSPGIPLPPFAQQRRAEAAPKPSAAQQTIKVEVGEEIIEERKKLAKRAALYAGIAGVVAFGFGFGLGGVRESGARATAAAKGAATIEKDVKAANEKMKELEVELKAAYEKLNPQGDKSNRSFPEDLATKLGGINIPFDATNLENKPGENKQVGNLPGRVLRALLAYTSAVEDVNKTKDSLKNVLGLVKDPITNAWKEEKEPMANYAVVFRGEGSGAAAKVVAELAPIKKPFAWKGDWGNDFGVSRLENGKPADKTAKRYAKGDLPGNDLQGIPVDPKTMAGLTGDVGLRQLNKAIADILKDLDGGANPDNPADDKAGLIKQGEDLALQLHNASMNQ